MKKLFAQLREFLDNQEKIISDASNEDALVALGDMVAEFGEIVGAFQQAVGDALLDPDNQGDIGDIEVPEPEFAANIAALAEAAVLTLAIRGDIVDQLRESGFESQADAVASLLDARIGDRVKSLSKR